jgi:hypothetical protein
MKRGTKLKPHIYIALGDAEGAILWISTHCRSTTGLGHGNFSALCQMNSRPQN